MIDSHHHGCNFNIYLGFTFSPSSPSQLFSGPSPSAVVYWHFSGREQHHDNHDDGDEDHDFRQGWVYRIENLSNADISDFSVYRRVYRIEPLISSISIFSIPVIFLSFFVKNSPKIQKIPRKFWKPMNQSPQQQQQQQHRKIPKIRRKFWKFAENSLKRRPFLRH